MIKVYQKLTKFGIVLFVLLSGLAGYAMSLPVDAEFSWGNVVFFLCGLYLVSSGSFALNQSQEWKLDQKMQRTHLRPIPLGMIRPWQGYLVGLLLSAVGLLILYLIHPLTMFLCFATLIMYNLLYTPLWKKYWVFGAVPGAIPGAMPVVIGYSVNTNQIFTPECVYLFLLMFLWQMPHFWSLAIRYREDYKNGGFPVLPVELGVTSTIYHLGLYFCAYVGLVFAAPFFVKAHAVYLLILIPLSVKLIWEFVKYYRSNGETRWLPFFMWTTFSVLLYLGGHVADRWLYLATM